MITATLSEEIVIGPDDNGLLMTPEEFDEITDFDEGYQYELIRGVLVVNPPAGVGERDPNEELGHLLRTYQEAHPGVIDATVYEQYVRTLESRRLADRVIWIGLGRIPNPRQDVPTIVVEFVSKRRRDRLRDYVDKRDEYLAIGVTEYWVIDRYRRTMTVFRPEQRKSEPHVLAEDAIYQTPLLPGFELPLGRLLGRADRWQAEEAEE